MTKLLTIFFDGSVFSQILNTPERQNYGWDLKSFGPEMMQISMFTWLCRGMLWSLLNLTIENAALSLSKTWAW